MNSEKVKVHTFRKKHFEITKYSFFDYLFKKGAQFVDTYIHSYLISFKIIFSLLINLEQLDFLISLSAPSGLFVTSHC